MQDVKAAEKADRSGLNIQFLEKMKTDGEYYDKLYEFACAVMGLNQKAFDDGTKPQELAKSLAMQQDAFFDLCMGNVQKEPLEPKTRGRKPKQAPEQPKEEPKQLPNNFMKEENGWGLCPICRKKILKLTKTTKLIDFPAYCKSCKTEYIISWWNVEDKDIEYTRYVNERHYIKERDIRSEGMKGTGVKNFITTRTSATERAAIRLQND